MDEDGFITLTGRSKELIIRSGHNIAPSAIENVLAWHPEVSAAAAVGRPDPRTGEMPVAFVELVKGGNTTAHELREFCKSSIEETGTTPADVTILKELPRTAVGKTFKPTLQHLAREMHFSNVLSAKAAWRAISVSSFQECAGTDVIEFSVPSGHGLTKTKAELENLMGAYALNWRLRVEKPKRGENHAN